MLSASWAFMVMVSSEANSAVVTSNNTIIYTRFHLVILVPALP